MNPAPESADVKGMASPGSYRPQLDGLRAIAVILVAVYHWLDLSILGVEPPLGKLGVGLFFVLSGYLIAGILLDVRARAEALGASRWRATRAFAMRRMVRLVPALYVYLVAVSVLGFTRPGDGILWHAIYAGNFRIAELGYWPAGVSHLWSLSVEEQFYILAPVFTLFMPTRSIRPVLLALVVSTTMLATISPSPLGSILPPQAFVGLMIGALLAAEIDEGTVFLRRLSRLGPALVLFGLAATLTGLELAGALPLHSRALADLCWFVLMATIVHRAAVGYEGVAARILESRPARYLGRVSYGVYLWHLVAPDLRHRFDFVLSPQHEVIEFVLASAVTLGLAALSDRLVERRFNALKTRYPYIADTPTVSAGAPAPVPTATVS